VLDALPRNAVGKIAKPVLRAGAAHPTETIENPAQKAG
jgi:hypothetical protein